MVGSGIMPREKATVMFDNKSMYNYNISTYSSKTVSENLPVDSFSEIQLKIKKCFCLSFVLYYIFWIVAILRDEQGL